MSHWQIGVKLPFYPFHHKWSLVRHYDYPMYMIIGDPIQPHVVLVIILLSLGIQINHKAQNRHPYIINLCSSICEFD